MVTVTTKTAFDAQTPCRGVWEDLMDDGKLSPKTGIKFNNKSPRSPCCNNIILRLSFSSALSANENFPTLFIIILK